MEPVSTSKRMLWSGRIISGLIVLFMLMDVTIHLLKPQPVVAAFAQLGWPISLAPVIAGAAFISMALYAIPRTAVLGAILLTGYLGGATATHLRVEQPFYFPIGMGILVWLGLYLRDERVRGLFLPANRPIAESPKADLSLSAANSQESASRL